MQKKTTTCPECDRQVGVTVHNKVGPHGGPKLPGRAFRTNRCRGAGLPIEDPAELTEDNAIS